MAFRLLLPKYARSPLPSFPLAPDTHRAWDIAIYSGAELGGAGSHLRTSVRRAINADTGLLQELAKQMSEVTRQIAGLTNELESLLPRDRHIRDRPTNAPPAGCSDDDENWGSQGDEIASKSLATGSCFPTNLVILPGGSTVDENRNRAGA